MNQLTSLQQQQQRQQQPQQQPRTAEGDPQPTQQDDNPQRNVEPFATASYTDNPMNPNPTLLRKIAGVASGGEADQSVTDWAQAFNDQYPE